MGPGLAILGSFSNHSGNGNDDVKKAIGLFSKTTILHVQHTFCLGSVSKNSIPAKVTCIWHFIRVEIKTLKKRENFLIYWRFRCRLRVVAKAPYYLRNRW